MSCLTLAFAVVLGCVVPVEAEMAALHGSREMIGSEQRGVPVACLYHPLLQRNARLRDAWGLLTASRAGKQEHGHQRLDEEDVRHPKDEFGERRIGESPCLIRIHAIDKQASSLVFRQPRCNVIVYRTKITFVRDGRVQSGDVPVTTQIARPPEIKFSLKDTKVYDMKGTSLDAVEVLKRANPGMTVLIARQNDKLGLSYLFAIDNETLLLLVPVNQEVPRPEAAPPSFLLPFVEPLASSSQRILCDFRLWWFQLWALSDSTD